jgi:hypothetical protein
LFVEQASPSVLHVVLGFWQWPLVQALLQHWAFEEHAPVASTQVLAVEHVKVAGSQ